MATEGVEVVKQGVEVEEKQAQRRPHLSLQIPEERLQQGGYQYLFSGDIFLVILKVFSNIDGSMN